MRHLQKGKSWLEIINESPPVFCRIVARTGRGVGCRPLTTEEIAERSGLHRDQVREISRLTNWNRMPAKNIEAFAKACGVDLMRTKEHWKYLRRGTLGHIQNAKPNQRASLFVLVHIFKKRVIRVEPASVPLADC